MLLGSAWSFVVSRSNSKNKKNAGGRERGSTWLPRVSWPFRPLDSAAALRLLHATVSAVSSVCERERSNSKSNASYVPTAHRVLYLDI